MSALAVAAAGAVMAGAAVQSSVGFGFALVAAPLLYAAAPSPEQAVGLMIVLGLEVNLLTLLAERRRPEPVVGRRGGGRRVVAARRAGRRRRPARARRAGAAAARDRRRARGAGRQPACAPARRAPRRAPGGRGRSPGSARARCTTSTSTGGPPVVLLLMGRGLTPRTIRDTLTTAFAGFAPVAAAALAITGTSRGDPRRDLAGGADPAHRDRPARSGARCSPGSPRAAPTSACSPSSCSSRLLAGLLSVALLGSADEWRRSTEIA